MYSAVDRPEEAHHNHRAITIPYFTDAFREQLFGFFIPGADQHFQDIVAEVYALERVRGHPCFVNLLDAFFVESPKSANRQAWLVMERSERSLARIVDAIEFSGLGHQSLKVLASEMSTGMLYLHSLGILHTDLKPPNILESVSSSGEFHIRIADLGCCVQVPREWSIA